MEKNTITGFDLTSFDMWNKTVTSGDFEKHLWKITGDE